jgi:membrane fusion protein
MTVVPSGAHLQATLYVPTRAIGFVQSGQEVRLQVDAFAYSHFGTISGKVSQISAAPIVRTGVNGQAEPVYLVTATLNSASPALRDGRKLRSGMTLTASIITERRSLAEWLFEPVWAVRRR